MSSHFESVHCGRELVVRHLADRSTPNGVSRISLALFAVIVPKRVEDANPQTVCSNKHCRSRRHKKEIRDYLTSSYKIIVRGIYVPIIYLIPIIVIVF
jgi:hypothetical protein